MTRLPLKAKPSHPKTQSATIAPPKPSSSATRSWRITNPLEAIWLDSYKPKDKAERHLLDQLVTADWFLARSTRRYNEVETAIFERCPNPCYWQENDHRLITRFTRYRTAHTNSVARHKKMLEDYRKARLAESNNEVKLAHDEVKLKVYQEKNKPELTVEEIIAGMQKRAAALGFPRRQLKSSRLKT